MVYLTDVTGLHDQAKKADSSDDAPRPDRQKPDEQDSTSDTSGRSSGETQDASTQSEA